MTKALEDEKLLTEKKELSFKGHDALDYSAKEGRTILLVRVVTFPDGVIQMLVECNEESLANVKPAAKRFFDSLTLRGLGREQPACVRQTLDSASF